MEEDFHEQIAEVINADQLYNAKEKDKQAAELRKLLIIAGLNIEEDLADPEIRAIINTYSKTSIQTKKLMKGKQYLRLNLTSSINRFIKTTLMQGHAETWREESPSSTIKKWMLLSKSMIEGKLNMNVRRRTLKPFRQE
jgi:hypothetical protein